MTSLGDFIGRLAAEMGNGRAQADLAAARLAEVYRAHPLLADFPIPRFRLPTVELSVPVVIDTVPSATAPGTVEAAAAAVQTALASELRRRNVVLTAAELANVKAQMDDQVTRLVEDDRAQSSALVLADELSDAVISALPDRIRTPAAAAEAPQPSRALGPVPFPGRRPGRGPTAEIPMEDDVRAAARLAVVSVRAQPNELQVKVTAAELAGASPNSVVRVNLSLSEQGLEWFGTDQSPDRLRAE